MHIKLDSLISSWCSFAENRSICMKIDILLDTSSIHYAACHLSFSIGHWAMSIFATSFHESRIFASPCLFTSGLLKWFNGVNDNHWSFYHLIYYSKCIFREYISIIKPNPVNGFELHGKLNMIWKWEFSFIECEFCLIWMWIISPSKSP